MFTKATPIAAIANQKISAMWPAILVLWLDGLESIVFGWNSATRIVTLGVLQTSRENNRLAAHFVLATKNSRSAHDQCQDHDDGGISWLSVQRPARHDLSSATYLRTTGPLGLVYIYGGAILRLADRSFIVNGKEGIPALSSISWGTVDYSPHGHMILSAWNSKGKSVYCLPGYKLGGQASQN